MPFPTIKPGKIKNKNSQRGKKQQNLTEKKKNLNLEHVLSIVRIIEVLLLLSFKIIFRWKINYIVCFL